MTTYTLTNPEKAIFSAVRDGATARFHANAQQKTIRSSVLRHIILGLPVVEEGQGILLKASSLFGLSSKPERCPVTGAGVSIEGAIIAGDLDLGSVLGDSGGPLFPLVFAGCLFDGRFSARNAHFSRLSFTGCEFTDGAKASPSRAPGPTIDLSGARLDRQFDLEKVKPRTGGDLLWIRAPGICVGGGINLSGAILRAPAARLDGREREAALDLTLGQIEGDLSFDCGSEADGRLKLRAIDVRGDVWLDHAKLDNRGEREEALFLQGARIRGYLSLQYPDREPANVTVCNGRVDLTAAEIGRSLLMKCRVTGDIKAADLIVRDDLILHGEIAGCVILDRARIGGSLDVSRLKMQKVAVEPPLGKSVASASSARAFPLSIANGTIGAALQLTPKPPRFREEEDEPFDAGFHLDGLVDLTGLSCDTLDDAIGDSWGEATRIRMNHFTYRQTGWAAESHPRRKATFRFVFDRIQAALADSAWPERHLRDWRDRDHPNFWEPWQMRRNWIYRQFESDETRAARANPLVSIARHGIREEEYRPQPFEQAIRVARGEGRDDFANQFEILKQRLEWRFFNRRVRWPLGFIAIIFAASWLAARSSFPGALWTMGALIVTLVAMLFGSSIHRWVRAWIVRPAADRSAWVLPGLIPIALLSLLLWRLSESSWVAAIPLALLAVVLALASVAAQLFRPIGDSRHTNLAENVAKRVEDARSKALTWITYWIPALVLFFAAGWADRPFHIIISTMIFAAIRLLSVIAHAVMRFGFGYMRRPVNAVVTLILAFLIGWWGVGLAKSRNMFVVAAQPTAEVVGRFGIPDAESAKNAHAPATETVHAMGSLRGLGRAVRDLSCSHEISVPLYALDVLVPIVDLGERERCEIRRFATSAEPPPADMPPRDLYRSFPELLLRSHRFWWWMEAIYAILGWVLVSLSILTFAQVNRTHAEPPHEHK
jgi:hypothetical protein